ncbi:hypothetical protein DFH11DRAFT_1627457 [Phellopilus nigrolimitatus]|nr:hypothetical protein DFH11DRAFT_1627457 [Phellopilus nigrolimitatus]
MSMYGRARAGGLAGDAEQSKEKKTRKREEQKRKAERNTQKPHKAKRERKDKEKTEEKRRRIAMDDEDDRKTAKKRVHRGRPRARAHGGRRGTPKQTDGAAGFWEGVQGGARMYKMMNRIAEGREERGEERRLQSPDRRKKKRREHRGKAIDSGAAGRRRGVRPA